MIFQDTRDGAILVPGSNLVISFEIKREKREALDKKIPDIFLPVHVLDAAEGRIRGNILMAMLC